MSATVIYLTELSISEKKKPNLKDISVVSSELTLEAEKIFFSIVLIMILTPNG